jgi:hypothetical protein
MWRLPEDDIQRQRCIKAATENIKKDFFVNASSHSHGAKGLEVIEVYKIENQTLLKSFHEYTVLQAQMGQQSSNQIKVKGLFCTIPIESLEHAIVYGMHAKKYQQEDEEILFSQKLIDM